MRSITTTLRNEIRKGQDIGLTSIKRHSDKISIIIPVLNEAVYIGKLLTYLKETSSPESIQEIIVVDGGSTDNSTAIISSFENVILLKTEKGRARQMNRGAQQAQGGILYFLHADTFPPSHFAEKIIQYVDDNKAGCFRLKFENSNHFLLKIAKWLTPFNFLIFRGGDQSLYIKKKDFIALGGYNEQYIIYEDIELLKRICSSGAFNIIPDYVTTSDRKFRKNGIWKLYFNFLMIHVKHWIGASPQSLNDYYQKYIRE